MSNVIKKNAHILNFSINGTTVEKINKKRIQDIKEFQKSFDQINRRRNIYRNTQNRNAVISDAHTQTFTQNEPSKEDSPYKEMYSRFETKIEKVGLFTPEKQSKSLIASEVKTRRVPLLNKVYHNNFTNSKPDLKDNPDLKHRIERTTSKVKRRRNLYDISSLVKYKSICKIEVGDHMKTNKKIIVVPDSEKLKRKLSESESNYKNKIDHNNKVRNLFRLDMLHTKASENSYTTRKNNASKEHVGNSSDVHSKLREISHEYTDSTHVNSNGSSGTNS